MSHYMNERQRVETAVPARLVFGLAVCNCFSDPDADVVKQLKELLLRACVEPVEGLGPKEGGKVARRIERVCEAAAKEFDGQPAVKIAMALFYFLEDLLSREVLTLWEGSAFGEAMTLLMPMFEHGFESEKIDASARKQARKLLERLQREGYFRQ